MKLSLKYFTQYIKRLYRKLIYRVTKQIVVKIKSAYINQNTYWYFGQGIRCMIVVTWYALDTDKSLLAK